MKEEEKELDYEEFGERIKMEINQELDKDKIFVSEALIQNTLKRIREEADDTKDDAKLNINTTTYQKEKRHYRHILSYITCIAASLFILSIGLEIFKQKNKMDSKEAQIESNMPSEESISDCNEMGGADSGANNEQPEISYDKPNEMPDLKEKFNGNSNQERTGGLTESTDKDNSDSIIKKDEKNKEELKESGTGILMSNSSAVKIQLNRIQPDQKKRIDQILDIMDTGEMQYITEYMSDEELGVYVYIISIEDSKKSIYYKIAESGYINIEIWINGVEDSDKLYLTDNIEGLLKQLQTVLEDMIET